MKNYIFKIKLVILTILFLILTPFAQSQQNNQFEFEPFSLTISGLNQTNNLSVHAEVFMNSEEIEEALGNQSGIDSKSEIVVSANMGKGENIYLVPIKSLVLFLKKTKSSIEKDKIGFILVCWTVGVQVYAWVHAANLTTFQKTGNVVFSILLAALFSIEKDNWSKVTKPIQTQIRKMFNKVPNLITTFGATFILTNGISFMRIPFLSLDSIKSAAPSFLSNPFVYTTFLSFISTIGYFAWADFIGFIDEKTFSKAKLISRTMININSFIIGTFASSAMLLNPDYGIFPWITLASVGTIGIVLNWKKEAAIQTMQKIDFSFIVEKYSSAVFKLKNLLNLNKNRCSDIFSY